MSELRYRPEIDGLRAIAVLVVIVDHARFEIDGAPFLPGGFLGVDVFFVISGYLISLILLRGMARDDFRLVHFWERRVRRIIPALFLVLLCTLLGGWLVLFPAEQLSLANSALATLGFVSNFWFWSQTDYWAPASLTMPLLHTWSLAVEEQFYLLYPLFLLALYRWRSALVPWMMLGVILVSLTLAVQRQQKKGIEQVELLLHGQRPGVQ
ncbi:MAG: acyltransferase, partial [Verrucomicrobiota bacterium]